MLKAVRTALCAYGTAIKTAHSECTSMQLAISPQIEGDHAGEVFFFEREAGGATGTFVGEEVRGDGCDGEEDEHLDEAYGFVEDAAFEAGGLAQPVHGGEERGPEDEVQVGLAGKVGAGEGDLGEGCEAELDDDDAEEGHSR